MRAVLVISLLYCCFQLGRSQGTVEKLPAAVYNPWFSYLLLKWLAATNPQLAAELIKSFPKGSPVQYHTLAGTAVHLGSSRVIPDHHRLPPFRTDNFLNSQVTGHYKFDHLV
uniref:Uncharacterized protein n=1 Tax=Lygus hesperus TaxID=30085 RepID=A0A0K8T104_LYGHE